MNRHQHFALLGRAYWLTGDERYAQTFVEHLVGWMDSNPPKLGVNWISSLEVAFRSISWLWAFFFFKNSAELKPAIFLLWLKFIYLHARHLETYLSLYSSPNTHLTGEALGLFYIGTLLPELHDAARWRATAKKILLTELKRHVRPDGVYFEQTSYYHRYTTDFYLHLHALLKTNGEQVENEIEAKLILLLDHMMSITRPDGTTPFFGDDDGGKLMMLDEKRAANDFRATLSTGASLFARSDYKYVAREAAEETLWLLGIGGLENFDRLESVTPAHESCAFADGGYYVMRDGWTREANYMLIDCGPHGALNCGHAHADALSFDMAARGRTLLVDPGTYTYTGSSEMRDRFRSSAAHNTLTVDCIQSSEPDGPFSWKQIAEARARQWISHRRFDYFEGEHNGYARLDSPVTHVRSVLFLKENYWIIRDRVVTVGAHRYDLHFHFTPDAAPMIDGRSAVAAARERQIETPGLEMFAFGSGGRGEWHKENGYISPRYGERFDAPTLVFSAEGAGAQDFFTFLIPRDSQSPDSPVSQAREIKSTGGRSFEISCGASRDVLHVGEGRVTNTTGATDAKLRLASDFDWAWARFSSDTGTLEQLVLIGGSQFSINGCEIMNAKDRIEYAVARRVGQELMVETPASEERRVIFQMDVSGVLTEEMEAVK